MTRPANNPQIPSTQTFCLSIDIDWADDDVIIDTLELVLVRSSRLANAFVEAGFTHESNLFYRIRSTGSDARN